METDLSLDMNLRIIYGVCIHSITAISMVIMQTLYLIIHPFDPTVVICYLIWPCDIVVRITYLISHSSSLSYNTVIKGYFRLSV